MIFGFFFNKVEGTVDGDGDETSLAMSYNDY